MVMEMIQSKDIQQYEKLKLVILYSLRWENDEKIEKLKDILRDNGISQVLPIFYLVYYFYLPE